MTAETGFFAAAAKLFSCSPPPIKNAAGFPTAFGVMTRR
jgi:hypothetical protein